MKAAKDLRQFHNIIDGKLVPASAGETMDSIDPATGKPWSTIPLSTTNDVDSVVKAASKAFPAWSALPARSRADYLRQIGDALSEHGEELLTLETRNNGWTLDPYQYLNIVLKQIWYDAAGAAPIVGAQGKTVQMGTGNFGYTRREPYGVVLGILPWNAGLFSFTIKAAYALAAGNTVIIKPSEHAASASLRYGEILSEILPPGVVNVISGLGSEIGDVLVGHKQVNKVSMTGSKQTAEMITRASAPVPKSLIFELGGKSPNIIFEDADINQAVNGVINGIFTRNAGQICAAGSRILVHRPIFDRVIGKIKEHMTDPENVKYGDTLDTTNTMGPIANLPQYRKVCSYLQIGKEEGAELIFGGRTGGEVLLPDDPHYSDGYWVEPTLFKTDNNKLQICQEEVFGPIAVAIPFDDEEEAVRIANDTDYGLASGVWTQDLKRAQRMTEKIEAGNVWVNTYAMVGPDLPFGGFKESGYGTDTVLEYTREKACVINFN
ncbi:aldehyde dehydrogenase [Virgibacillus phasianinus]|uniref:Aldehyde dehydrogenase n=1 Tax=Virgibacillus phasianinus TaxID=2017483 RepID=A0A220U2J3_9BACI|nr:aldehyde dehydrogenase family protein [Virgibacillus phasianinus]ASK62378.1 aldehyde dehydrogenase [Virgibacillus phasianinus]